MIYTNFLLLCWTKDAFTSWELIGLYIAAFMINVIEWPIYIIGIDKLHNKAKDKCLYRIPQVLLIAFASLRATSCVTFNIHFLVS